MLAALWGNARFCLLKKFNFEFWIISSITITLNFFHETALIKEKHIAHAAHALHSN